MKQQPIEKPNITSVYDFYGLIITGRDHGLWRKASCPMPDHEDRNPSASVNEDHGQWICHACGNHGDGYDIIRERESLDRLADCIEFAARIPGALSGEVRERRGSGGSVSRKPGHRSASGSWKPPWLQRGTGAGA